MEWDDEIRQDLQVWAGVADEIHHYGATVDDYTNDLCYRDALEEHLRSGDPVLEFELRHELAGLDARFRAATVEDTDGELGHYFNIKLKSGWWWSRIPEQGSLADYLRARAAERPQNRPGRIRRMLGGS